MPKKDIISAKVQSAIDDYRESFAQGVLEPDDYFTKDADHETVSEEIAEARRRQPFIDFVCATHELHAFDFQVLYDYVAIDGWRTIIIRCFPIDAESWLSMIFLPPAAAGRFSPALDIPF